MQSSHQLAGLLEDQRLGVFNTETVRQERSTIYFKLENTLSVSSKAVSRVEPQM